MGDLSFENADRLLHYDPETGIIRWKVDRNKCPAGSVAGCSRDTGHISIEVHRRGYRATRLAFLLMTGSFPVNFVLHKDGDRSNNRWDNLREAAPGESTRLKQEKTEDFGREVGRQRNWSDEEDANLTLLWAKGYSTQDIGTRMHRSKGSIVGRAHRLDLDGRESPIIRSGAPTVRRVRNPKKTLTALPSVNLPDAIAPVPLASTIELFRTIARVPVRSVAVLPLAPRPVAPVPVVAAPKTGVRSACCWPFGTPGKKDFRFCTETAMLGKPYCAEHHQRAHVRIPRDRNEDAVA